MWTGPVWPLRSCSISTTRCCKLRLALLELLDLLNDRVQPRGLLLRRRDLRVELRSTRCASAQYRQPMNSPAQHQDQAAADRQLLAGRDEGDQLSSWRWSRSAASRLMRIIGRPPF